MNKIIPAVLALLAASPALAQNFTPAPVPNRVIDVVSPADRVGRPDGSERSSPFSGLPNTVGAGTGQDTPVTTDQERTSTAPTPNLSR